MSQLPEDLPREPTGEARFVRIESRIGSVEERFGALERRVEVRFGELHDELGEQRDTLAGVQGDVSVVRDRTGIMLQHLESTQKLSEGCMSLGRLAIERTTEPAMWQQAVALAGQLVRLAALVAIVFVVLGTAATGLTLAGYGIELSTAKGERGRSHAEPVEGSVPGVTPTGLSLDP